MPRCKTCREKFEPKQFNQKNCFENPECIQAELELKKKAQSRKWKAEKKERKNKLKTRGEHEKDLQTPINKIVRLIDWGTPCMMCGNAQMKRINACHYHSVGSSNVLRFNLLNNWHGCHSCNCEKGGNIVGYDEQLIEIYGEDMWKIIKFDIKRFHTTLKLTTDEIQEYATKARAIARRLEKEKRVRTPIERWELREEINKELGIYFK